MQSHAPLVDAGFLRLDQIVNRPASKNRPAVAGIVPVSRSTWLAGVRSGRYPKPTRALGTRITAWRCEDIRTLLESAAKEIGS